MKYISLIILFFSSFTMANDINIHVYGSVIVSPCEVEKTNYLIDFKKINIGALQHNQKSNWIDFSIKLKNCPVSTKKSIMTIKGEPDRVNSNYFINTGTAKNIALDLIESTSKLNIKNGTKLETTINHNTKSAEYFFSARIIKSGNEISAGTFRSHLEFTLFYN